LICPPSILNRLGRPRRRSPIVDRFGGPVDAPPQICPRCRKPTLRTPRRPRPWWRGGVDALNMAGGVGLCKSGVGQCKSGMGITGTAGDPCCCSGPCTFCTASRTTLGVDFSGTVASGCCNGSGCFNTYSTSGTIDGSYDLTIGSGECEAQLFGTYPSGSINSYGSGVVPCSGTPACSAGLAIIRTYFGPGPTIRVTAAIYCDSEGDLGGCAFDSGTISDTTGFCAGTVSSVTVSNSYTTACGSGGCEPEGCCNGLATEAQSLCCMFYSGTATLTWG
jgi:hypothetical protein